MFWTAPLLEGELVERTPAEIVSALGPPGGALVMDLRLSNFAVTEQLGWTPSAPFILYKLLHGTLS